MCVCVCVCLSCLVFITSLCKLASLAWRGVEARISPNKGTDGRIQCSEAAAKRIALPELVSSA